MFHPLPGTLAWLEIATSDPNGAQKFYGNPFDWTFEADGPAASSGLGYRNSSSRAPRCRLGGRGLGGPGVGGDVPGEVGGVVVDETEQRRATGVLPGQAEEIQPGDLEDPALVNHLAVADHARDADPGVVGAEAGRPDNDAGLQRGSLR
jgi:hypothetical protein